MTTEEKLRRFVQSIANGDRRTDAPGSASHSYREGWRAGLKDVEVAAQKVLKEIAKEKGE
jgi:hypothetical protein